MNYELRNRTYIAEAKSSPRDRIEVEVGDVMQTDKFYPQVKLKRWDNEVNLSLRFTLPGNQQENVTYQDNKIIWEKAGYKAIFYDKPDASDEGGFEFEIHLPKKPPINSLTFTVNTKELDFFYQPPLTAEEIAEGAVRPENVVGSYAVYHKTKRDNWVGGKEYRTGKAFHIYRPHAVDSAGNSVYGELLLDEQAGTMTVTVPQSFLNSAIYPVVVDPTFGYTSAGASSSTATNNFAHASNFTPPTESDYVISDMNISLIFNSNGGVFTADQMLAIYEVPSIGHGSEYKLANTLENQYDTTYAQSWQNYTFSSNPTLTIGTNLDKTRLVLFQKTQGNTFPNGTFRAYYDTSSSGSSNEISATYPTWPSNLTAGSGTRKYSIYATYTTGTPATRRVFVIS